MSSPSQPGPAAAPRELNAGVVPVTDEQLDDIVQAAEYERDRLAGVLGGSHLAHRVARAEAILALVAEVRAVRAALAAPQKAFG